MSWLGTVAAVFVGCIAARFALFHWFHDRGWAPDELDQIRKAIREGVRQGIDDWRSANK